jgi:glycosyltransferase involved in cell wall biosynthesis
MDKIKYSNIKTVSSNRKIAIFLASLRGGGAERNMLRLANSCADRGLKVDLVLAQNDGTYFSEISPKVKLVNLNASRVILSFPQLITYLKKEKPITLICALNHVNLVAIWAKLYSGVPSQIIVTVRNTLSQGKQDFFRQQKISLMRRLIHYFYPKADEIIAVSKGVADDLAKTAKLPREKIKVIYNPVVTPQLLEQAKTNIEHSWFSPRESPVILGVGRLTQQKDFPTLIKAFAILQQNYSARLMILGEGEERPQLENLIKELKLQNKVSLSGFVSNPFAYMSQASLFVLSSAREGLPTVLIEAMAVGTPVVSTNCPSGPEEILEEGKYGSLVPVGDVEKLAKAMVKTLHNPQSSEVLQHRAMEFSMENSVNQYLALFN